MNSVNLVDYVVIGLYALLMVLVGLYVMRFNRGAAEYFRGGSRVPWLVAGLSCFMSGFSWTFTGAAGVAYRAGVAAIGLYIGNALSFLLGYFVFATRWRRSRITTVMEYLSSRFNLATHQTFSWATIVFQLFTSASMLYGLSLFVCSACGFPVTWTILGAGAIIVFYCVIGGLWAVVVTDFLQASILMPFCLVLVIASLARVGGIAGLFHSLPPEMKTLKVSGEFGWIYLVSWTIMVAFGYNTGAMAQRYFSVETEGSARKVALLCCGLFLAGAFLWFIPPMAMRTIYPDLHALWPSVANPSEGAYAVASLTLLPHGLIGVMLGAFVYHWSLIQQVAYLIPASFGIFFLSMLFDRGDTPARARLFEKLNTPIDVEAELKDSSDFTAPVFRFLSRTISGIGLLSLLLLLAAPADQRATILWFAALTVSVGGSLYLVRGPQFAGERNSAVCGSRAPLPWRHD